MITLTLAKCPCHHCSGKIEFDATEFIPGQIVTCPHCGMDTQLFIVRALPSPHSVKRSPLSKSWKWAIACVLMLTVAIWGLAYGLTHRWFTPDSLAEIAGTAVGGIIGATLLVVAFLVVVMWILFPVMVYYKLTETNTRLGRIENKFDHP